MKMVLGSNIDLGQLKHTTTTIGSRVASANMVKRKTAAGSARQNCAILARIAAACTEYVDLHLGLILGSLALLRRDESPGTQKRCKY